MLLLGSALFASVSLLNPDSLHTTLVIRDVTVIDATGAPPAPHRELLIQDGRIRAVTALRTLRVPRGAQVVEGGGRFVIPGLWDMHVHMSSIPVSPIARGASAYQSNSRYYLPLFIAWGITGVRDMSGNLELLTAWRDSVARGTLLGPRMLVTGFKLGSPHPAMPGAPYPLRTETDVRTTVRMLRDHGADFVKVADLPRELVPALADECRRQGLVFVGHLPTDMSVTEASQAGQRGIEHLDGVLLSLSSQAVELRERERQQDSWWMRLLVRFHLKDADRSRLELHREILASASQVQAERLYSLLVRNQTWQEPTLSELRDLHRVPGSTFAAEQRDYVPPLRGPIQLTHWDKDPALGRLEFDRQVQVVGDMFRAGVSILAGTDTPGPERIPGFSLAEELQLLVRAGFSPMAALQAATREPARFLGATDSLGTIEPGKLADLVLLNGDPLADIRNVHAVHAVVLRGRYLSPAQLDSLRASVRSLVAAWRDSVAQQRSRP
ncbi:MAG TPA: amidohydrolase family protein [Gemmatimonadales bacterium]|nr:amidohydrolase family protein [Gemmatimonadales bacterium]